MQPLTNLEEIAFNSGSSFDNPPMDSRNELPCNAQHIPFLDLEGQVTKLQDENTKLKQDLAIKKRDLRIVVQEIRRIYLTVSKFDATVADTTIALRNLEWLIKLLRAR
jgi:hypothetical protein